MEFNIKTRLAHAWRALIIDYWTPIIYNDYKFIIWR
nr:MAG TPA_asm: hypothetical protein [Caudoviricetes sp.]